jgi:hypothetical protein
VPRGFDAYARIFHPAYTRERGEVVRVRWAHIAAANTRVAHGGMQLNAQTGRSQYDSQPGIYEMAPRIGSLPRELVRPLLSVLSAHTASPARCWFAVWVGLGSLRPELRYAPTFAPPHREYALLEGRVDCALENFAEPRSYQSPTIWWPDDRAWCVATEVDLNTTYVGCSEPCRDDLLLQPELEAFAIDPKYGIDWRSDRLNPF